MNADQPGFVPLSRKASGLYILSSGTFSACGSMVCPTTRQSQRRSYINPRIPPRQPQARVGHPLSWSLMPKTKTGRVGHASELVGILRKSPTADAEYEYFRAAQYCSDCHCEQILDLEHHNLRKTESGMSVLVVKRRPFNVVVQDHSVSYVSRAGQSVAFDVMPYVRWKRNC
jgi:hypothetical protein